MTVKSQQALGKANVPKTVRAQKALALRNEGRNYQEIAADLGCSKGYAFKLVQYGLDRIVAEDVETMRLINGRRTEALLKGVWKSAEAGDIAASRQALRLLQHYARLFGLFAPEEFEVSGPGGGPAFEIVIAPGVMPQPMARREELPEIVVEPYETELPA